MVPARTAPRLRPPPPVTIVRRRSERSAARLAHQSGGLGVPSSNLGAPTSKIKDLIEYSTSKCTQRGLGRHSGYIFRRTQITHPDPLPSAGFAAKIGSAIPAATVCSGE